MTDDIDEIVLTREGIADLIRNEYDKAPDYWLAREKWDDGAERIADTILAALERLKAERDALYNGRETMGNLWAKEKARAEAAEKERDELRNQLEQAKAALGYYAAPDYNGHNGSGKLARDTLAALDDTVTK